MVAAGAFYGGMKYGSSQQSAQSNSSQGGQAGQFRNSSGTGSGRSGGFLSNGSTPLSGKILSEGNGELTIQLLSGNSSGSSRIVLFSSSTSVMKFVAGTPDDLTQGENITVIGTANSDGSVTAGSIQIRPAQQPGQGTSGR